MKRDVLSSLQNEPSLSTHASRRRFISTLGGVLGSTLLFGCSPLPSIDFFTQIEIEPDRSRLFIARARHGAYRARVVTAKDVTGNAFARVDEILKKTRADMCVNGSFFEEDGSPSGLLIIGGKVENPFITGKGDGVLHIDREGQIHLAAMDYNLLVRFLKDPSDFTHALQCNLLSRNGDILYRWWKKEPARLVPRNLIGISEWGVVDVIAKDTNFILGDQYMREVHRCHTVAALDGGGSAAGIDRWGNRSKNEIMDEKNEGRVPNFLIFEMI